MRYLRLTSSHEKQDFAIMPHSLVGYCRDEIGGCITLYTSSYAVNLSKDGWNNWDEFIEKVKTYCVDTEDF